MNNKVLVVLGPTASGKTRLSVELAKAFNGEVISADSMQIYKYMNIGTAKPDDEEKQGIPHHLMDIVEPKDTFTLQDYLLLAKKKTDDILSRGKLPIIAGGTGLYITSFMDNISLSDEEGDIEYREKLSEIAEREGGEVLLKKLEEIDPQTAERLHPNNVKRIIRALELYHTTGITITEQNERSKSTPSPYDFYPIGLGYNDREILYGRINHRVDEMMKKGLENEVRTLVETGLLPLDSNAFQAIGYKQFAPYFKSEISLEEVSENIKRESRRYAKRQITWFKRDPRIRWQYMDDINGDNFEIFFNKIVENIEKDILL